MQSENVREYQIIREEMKNLRDCITTYMGFTLGGSGLIFAGFATTNIGGYPPIFASLLLSLVVSLVLTIIFYKFNSHNRYAGYCKILNQERFEYHTNAIENPKNIRDFMAWEICMDQLRYSDIKENYLLNMCDEIDIEDIDKETLLKNIDEFSGKKPAIDNNKFSKGISLILKSIFKRNQSRSWQFPLYITLILGTIVITFLILAVHFYILMHHGEKEDLFWNEYFFGVLIILPVLFQFMLWVKYIGKLYTLMHGSATVDAFCWKFLPIRHNFIKEINNKIDYNITSMRDHDAEPPKAQEVENNN